jgi:hypothetical protein
MPNKLSDLIAEVTDEKSFLRFLTALREESEVPHDCRSYFECASADHWETRSTADFLRSSEDWGTRGDFADGEHYGEPMLRRIATMLYVGKYYRPEDRPR